MADARRYDDDIAALQAVTLRSDQIIQTAAVAVDQFIKGVTVKLHFVPGGADVFVRIHISGVHFDFLIKVSGRKASLQ